ncbi:carbohydrate esterase family 16 protein [Cadophora sp. DSE1049]|nr:carbohydrate esterase family 16 protein [Cadophora sp. DSE1049]
MSTKKSLAILLILGLQPIFATPVLKPRKYWKGFAHVDYLFTFGASYDTTTLPVPQWRSSNGPNWVDYIKTTFNQSKIVSINYAFGGATTDDRTTSAPLLPPTIKTQVEKQFIPTWGSQFKIQGSSNSDNSLFVLLAFPGNDILNSFFRNDSLSVIPKIFQTSDTLVDQLYDIGARNFVFNNLPELSKTPVVTSAAANDSSTAIETVMKQVKIWNEEIICLADRTQAKYHDVTIFQPDMYTLFREVFDDPTSKPETAGVTNTNSPCPVSDPTPNAINLYPECNPYLFIDQIHIQSPMHKAVARKMVEAITSEVC